MNQPEIPSAVPLARPAGSVVIAYATAPSGSAFSRFIQTYKVTSLYGSDLPRGTAIFDVICGLASMAVAFVLSLGVQVFDVFGSSPEWTLLTHVLLTGGTALLIIGWLLWRRGVGPRDIGLLPAPLGPTIGWGLLAIPACYIATVGVAALYLAFAIFVQGHSLKQIMGSKMEFLSMVADTPWLVIAPATLFIGLYEELLFRGLILTRLTTVFRSPLWAAVVSSVIFGSLHFSQGMLGMLQVGAVGFVFAVLTIGRKSLWPAIVAHFVMDALALFVSAAMRDNLASLPF